MENNTDSDAALVRQRWHGSYGAYIIGFILSLVLSVAAYLLVVEKVLQSWVLDTTLIVLGLIQAIAQLLFFLHIGKESKPRWNLLVLVFMILVVLIIVLGSLWIMFDLNARVMIGMKQ